MQQEILDYLKKIKPTKIGMLLLAGMILIIPFLIDLLLANADRRIMEKFSIVQFTVKGFVVIFLGILIYHLLFFIVSLLFNRRKKNSN